MVRATSLFALGLALIAGSGCFRGGEREKAPPAGLPGGFCQDTDGECDEGECDRGLNICYDPLDPCRGVFCGGSARGTCVPTDDDLPSCSCADGFDNDVFSLYCCPAAATGRDPLCGSSDESESSGE